MAEIFEGSETGNWNIAENWSNEMIFKPFYEASQYLTIAKFGSSNIEEDFTFDDNIKIQSRIKALEWSKEKIEQGISQCLFAIRNENDKKKVKSFLDEVIDLQKVINLASEKLTDRDKIKISINEDFFNIAYDCLKRIFREVTEPLNRADLIFNYKETFDPKKFKERIRDEFIEEG